MHKLLALLALLASLTATATLAATDPTCTSPKDKWMSEADFKAKITAEGFKIKNFKVTKGQCYEIYGTDKAGKKVEIHYDPATATPVAFQ